MGKIEPFVLSPHLRKMQAHTSKLIGKNKNAPRLFRLQRFDAVIRFEHTRFPPQQVRIPRGKGLPILRRLRLHPFVNEQQIRPRNRLVIQIRLPLGRREMFQISRELRDGCQHGSCRNTGRNACGARQG